MKKLEKNITFAKATKTEKNSAKEFKNKPKHAGKACYERNKLRYGL